MEADMTMVSVAKAPAAIPREVKRSIETPDESLAALRDGNLRFVNGLARQYDFLRQIESTKFDQKPHAAIVSCLDSRVPPEIVFDQGIGDVFVARVAGNVENADILGSLEFATEIIGAKLVVVMGHTRCGAVAGACNDVRLGHLTGLVGRIRPAIREAFIRHSDVPKGSIEFHDLVSERNVERTVSDIRAKSPILRSLEEDGRLKIVGAMYDVTTGRVRFL